MVPTLLVVAILLHTLGFLIFLIVELLALVSSLVLSIHSFFS
jgi:hypothetical protein